MSQTLGQLILKISSDTAGAEKGITDLNSKVGGAFNVLKAAINLVAVGAMAKWVDTTVKLGMEAERVSSIFAQTLKTTVGATNEQIAATQKWVEAQERVNHFDAEDMMNQMDKAIVKYGDIKTSQLALSAAQEVARLKNIDIAAAYELVASSSNGMARSLKQFGVEAVAGTSSASYLQQILDKTKGSADAFNKTTEGMTAGIKLSYEAMRETLGQALLPIANTLIQTLSPIIEKITAFLTAHMPQINEFVVALQKGIAWVVETAGKMYAAISPFIIAITETLGPYVKELFTWLGEHGINLQSVLVGVATVIGQAFTFLAAIVKGIIDSITWMVTKAQEAIAWLKSLSAAAPSSSAGIVVGSVGSVHTLGATPHAAGGWVGLHGPELAIVGEKGPELITPAGQTSGSDRAILNRLDDLIMAVTRVAPGVGRAINGMGTSIDWQ
jgi:predicted transcriptional regulator